MALLGCMGGNLDCVLCLCHDKFWADIDPSRSFVVLLTYLVDYHMLLTYLTCFTKTFLIITIQNSLLSLV